MILLITLYYTTNWKPWALDPLTGLDLTSELELKVKIGDSLRIHAYHFWIAAGKHPGPLLFLSIVNDMPISTKCTLLHADNCVPLVSGKGSRAVSDAFSMELESYNE